VTCADVASSCLRRSSRCLIRYIAHAIATLKMLRIRVEPSKIIPVVLSIRRLVRAERCGICVPAKAEVGWDDACQSSSTMPVSECVYNKVSKLTSILGHRECCRADTMKVVVKVGLCSGSSKRPLNVGFDIVVGFCGPL
jgi:hypothetical protein